MRKAKLYQLTENNYISKKKNLHLIKFQIKIRQTEYWFPFEEEYIRKGARV